MGRDGRLQANYAMGPDGHPLTLSDLPPTDTTRWVVRRKAQVVTAVQGGLISLDDACARYNLSVEEFLTWRSAIARFGMEGLKVTRAQDHREPARHPHH